MARDEKLHLRQKRAVATFLTAKITPAKGHTRKETHMSASKKTVKVATVAYEPANIKVDVTVDRDTKLFRATFADTVFEHADGKELEKIVLAAIKAALNIEWVGVIKVNPTYSSRPNADKHNDATLGLETERMWVAKFPGGEYKYSRWNAQGEKEQYRIEWSQYFSWDEERLGAFAPPQTKYDAFGRTTYYLPYSHQLWEQIQLLQLKIRELRAQVLSFFESQRGLDTLLGMRLLEPASEASTDMLARWSSLVEKEEK